MRQGRGKRTARMRLSPRRHQSRCYQFLAFNQAIHDMAFINSTFLARNDANHILQNLLFAGGMVAG